MIESADEGAAWYASIGPWVTAKAAAEYCKISERELLEWTESQQVLGVEFADAKYYYQARQFKDGGPVTGLDRVLAVLARAFRAPATQAGWLAGRAYAGMDITRWDLLRLGDVKLILDWAKADSEWVTRR
jgi:predicted NAD-dependent protein-ADP-ribosyltransferase YbiA (DUF1768 family)